MNNVLTLWKILLLLKYKSIIVSVDEQIMTLKIGVAVTVFR